MLGVLAASMRQHRRCVAAEPMQDAFPTEQLPGAVAQQRLATVLNLARSSDEPAVPHALVNAYHDGGQHDTHEFLQTVLLNAEACPHVAAVFSRRGSQPAPVPHLRWSQRHSHGAICHIGIAIAGSELWGASTQCPSRCRCVHGAGDGGARRMEMQHASLHRCGPASCLSSEEHTHDEAADGHDRPACEVAL